MKALIIAGAIALVLSILGTPLYIRLLVRKSYGQFVRDDGPTSHATKRGTPTMGGVAIILATLIAYGLTHLLLGQVPSTSALLVLFLMTGLGVVGFLDDFLKISRQRSLGLRARDKLIGRSSRSARSCCPAPTAAPSPPATSRSCGTSRGWTSPSRGPPWASCCSPCGPTSSSPPGPTA